MSTKGIQQVDEFIAAVDEPARSTLSALRGQLRKLLPDAEEGISYGLPVFKVGGRAVAGYSAGSKHCSYYPHSGNVIAELGDELKGFKGTKGALHFPLDRPLPAALVRKLVRTRLDEIERRGR
jgi:uncharacterized protein YdhG (YjbR/CyaY superfamily)